MLPISLPTLNHICLRLTLVCSVEPSAVSIDLGLYYTDVFQLSQPQSSANQASHKQKDSFIALEQLYTEEATSSAPQTPSPLQSVTTLVSASNLMSERDEPAHFRLFKALFSNCTFQNEAESTTSSTSVKLVSFTTQTPYTAVFSKPGTGLLLIPCGCSHFLIISSDTRDANMVEITLSSSSIALLRAAHTALAKRMETTLFASAVSSRAKRNMFRSEFVAATRQQLVMLSAKAAALQAEVSQRFSDPESAQHKLDQLYMDLRRITAKIPLAPPAV